MYVKRLHPGGTRGTNHGGELDLHWAVSRSGFSHSVIQNDLKSALVAVLPKSGKKKASAIWER
eukprot:scaffold156546_cov17-Prasinocladus_malaysianus.AAC.6